MTVEQNGPGVGHRRVLSTVGAVLIALLAAWLAVSVMTGPAGTAGNPAGGDLPAFYAAGEAVNDSHSSAVLYDRDLQKQRQHDLIGDKTIFLPFVYPPQVALAYSAIARVPYREAYLINSFIMWGALVVAIVMIASMVPVVAEHRTGAVVASTLFLPVTYSIGAGQNVTVALLLLVWMWKSLSDDREVLAGVAAGLMMYKPQYGLPLAGLLLVGRYWRAVAGCAATVALTVALNTVMFGTGWMSDWVTALREFASNDVTDPRRNLGIFQINPTGFIGAVFGESETTVIVGTAVSIMVVAVLIWLWADRSVELDLLFAATAAGLVLYGRYDMFYGAGIGILTVAVLAGRDRTVANLVPALSILGLSQYAAISTGFSPLGPVMAALFVAAAWPAAWHTPPTELAATR